jgi:long-subunit fatty acid transport protein
LLSFRAAFVGAALSCSVLSTAPLSAQDRPDIVSSGNGARAAGLGGATTAVANDIHSIGWNPAGLSFLTRPELGYQARLVFVSGDPSAEDHQPATFPVHVARNELTGAADLFEFIGYAYPIKLANRTVTFGAAYRRFADGVRAASFGTGRRETNGRYWGSTATSSKPGVSAISPTVAVEITPRIRVGATANLLGGSMVSRVKGPYPYSYTSSEEDYSGLAIEAGALVQATEALRIGLNATLPYDLKYTFDNDTTVRNVTRNAPLAISIGAAYRLNAKEMVTVDVRSAPWSSSVLTEDATGDTLTTIEGVEDAFSLHAGYERDVTNENRRALRRAGVFWKQTTIVDFNGASIMAGGVSVGQTWIRARHHVDFAVNYQRSERWTRHADAQRSIRIRNHDIALVIGIRRQY